MRSANDRPLTNGRGTWDIVFLISGRPVPAMLDMARYAQESGLRTLVVLLERGVEELIVDRSLIRYEVITIEVGYTSVDARRFISFPAIYSQIHKIVRSGLAERGLIIPSTYDLLMMARLLCIGRKFRLRHQVRDLHRLQLESGMLARMFIFLEKVMIQRAEMLIISAPAFFDSYYVKLFSHRVVLLENIPARSTWVGFSRRPRQGRPFQIGFVGIVRYPKSLQQIIASVQHLVGEGMQMELVFAGGGGPEAMNLLRDACPSVKSLGPYEYTRDIKRLYSDIDLIYSVYDSDDRNCQVAMPNKFYESIITKIPIVVASRTHLASEVQRLGIGASVESGDVTGLTDVLRRVNRAGDWYERAVRNLQQIDAESYFAKYDRALAECILPHSPSGNVG